MTNEIKKLPGQAWPKGVSGNPGGKSKSKMLTDAIRAELTQNPARVRKIAENLITMSEEGDLEATKIILDRIEGKPHQTLEIDSTVTTLTPDQRMGRILELQARLIGESSDGQSRN